MKKYLSLSILIFVLMLSAGAQKLSKIAPRVVLIGIGEKNMTFDESQYPNLNFYYTPQLIASNGDNTEVSGTPEFIATLWNMKSYDKGFMLFDENGICYTHGYDIMRQHNDLGARLCVDKTPLADHVKSVSKGKTAKVGKKEMKIGKTDFMVGYGLPTCELVASDGKTISSDDVINGQPTLVVFFNLPSDLDLNVAKESGEGKTGRAFMKSMMTGASGSKITSLFVELEAQFFENDVRGI